MITNTQPETIEELRAVATNLPPRTLGALVFPGYQALDLWGPLEVFGDSAPAVRPVLVGRDLRPVACAQGPRVVPDATIADAPRLDLLLVPGGNVGSVCRDAAIVDWIRCQASDAEVVMSVCNGAQVLADAGLLDGRRATTNKARFASIAAAHPKVTWIARARWVEDGKFVTSSGVSAGMDMALSVIARLGGERLADGIATYIEYDRHRDPTWDPFSEIHGLNQGGPPDAEGH